MDPLRLNTLRDAKNGTLRIPVLLIWKLPEFLLPNPSILLSLSPFLQILVTLIEFYRFLFVSDPRRNSKLIAIVRPTFPVIWVLLQTVLTWSYWCPATRSHIRGCCWCCVLFIDGVAWQGFHEMQLVLETFLIYWPPCSLFSACAKGLLQILMKNTSR